MRSEMKSLPILSSCFFIAVACVVPARAGGTWADRVGKMNRTELSAEEAKKQSTSEEKDQRNKHCLPGIKPAMPTVDWNADPTALPYMLYQINKRTDLPVYVEPG